MKSILYVVAIVISCAAGYFSYSNAGKQEEQLEQTKEVSSKNANLQVSIKKAKDDLKSEKELLDQANKAKADLVAETDNFGSKVTNINRSLSTIKNEIASLDERLEDFQKTKKEVEKRFGNMNIDLTKVPEFVEKLENERKKLDREYQELAAASEILTNQVTKNQETLGELQRRASDRTTSLRGNAASSTITAVNNSWGFVIIKPHPNASITEESKLIVVRGAQHVGRLKINSIEPNRIIADIDYESLAPGVRIQAGDKVILAVSNTR